MHPDDKTRKVSVAVYDRQLDYITDESPRCLFSGGYGSGKTVALCAKLLTRASRPGAREGLFRKTLVSLKKTTLKTLIEGDGGTKPLLPPGSYDWNKSECEIRLKGGGSILYAGLDDPLKIGSMNLSGANIDEAVELTEADWQMVASRVRIRVGGLPSQVNASCNPTLQLNAVCNPGVPSHWLARIFGLALGARAMDGHSAITVATSDNPFLPDEYVESQRTHLQGVSYKRFFLGQWVGSDGLVYDKWDRMRHVVDRKGPWSRTILAVDEGYTNPCAVLVIHEDAVGRLHIADEWYRRKWDREQKMPVIRSLADEHDAERVVIDPSAADFISQLLHNGVDACAAKNDVFDGILRVQARLDKDIDGLPALTVAPQCENVMREMETYEWAENRHGQQDKPVKANDHAMDALRYGVSHFDIGGVQVMTGQARAAETVPSESLKDTFERLRENPDWGWA